MNTGIILHIDHLLCAWGRWSARQRDGGNGYPCVSPMFNDMPKGDAYQSHCPNIDQDQIDTDGAIQRLDQRDRSICVEIYQIGGSVREIASRMGMATTTYNRKVLCLALPRIHREVMGHLNDISSGIRKNA